VNAWLVSYMKDKKGNIIQIGDWVKVLWAVDNREYEGKVVNIKENIALLSAKDFFVYVHRPERLLKIAA
jgi:hypothetical protein